MSFQGSILEVEVTGLAQVKFSYRKIVHQCYLQMKKKKLSFMKKKPNFFFLQRKSLVERVMTNMMRFPTKFVGKYHPRYSYIRGSL